MNIINKLSGELLYEEITCNHYPFICNYSLRYWLAVKVLTRTHLIQINRQFCKRNAEKEDTSKAKNDGSTQTHKLSDTASVVIKTKDGTELFRYDGGTMEDAVEALYAATDDVEISKANMEIP